MILGVDADPIGRSGSGNETYVRGIIGGLLDAFDPPERLILAGTCESALHDASGGRAEIIKLHPGLVGDIQLGRQLRKAGAEIALAHYNAPMGFTGPIATVIHDVAFIRHPRTFPTALRARINWSVRRSIRLSAILVTGSVFSKVELLDCYPELDSERIVVTPDAPRKLRTPTSSEVEAVLARFCLPERFVLAVGDLQPRKNLGRLVGAAASVGVPLVVVGRALWKSDQVLDAFNQGDVRWLGHVSDDDLAALYELCTVFAYPSLYEGYGLPVIEAMAAGAPVITSNVSALPEVAGSAAVLVDPFNQSSMAEGLLRTVRFGRASDWVPASEGSHALRPSVGSHPLRRLLDHAPDSASRRSSTGSRPLDTRR